MDDSPVGRCPQSCAEGCVREKPMTKSMLVMLSIALCSPALGGDPLKTLKPSHPRLLLTDARVAEVKRQAKTDPTMAKIVKDVIASAESMMSRQGLLLARDARASGRRLPVLAAAYRLTGKKSYADKAIDVMLAMSELEDWRPGHFLDVGEAAAGMALAYDWMYGVMDDSAREKVRGAIIEKGLRPGVRAYRQEEGTGWWVRRVNNWNNVCNGGMVLAALAVGDTDADLAREIISAAMVSMQFGLGSYDPGGALQEGPGYWRFATSYTSLALAGMQTALGTDFGIGDRDGLARTGWYPIYSAGPSGYYFNYSDSSTTARPGRTPFMFYLSRRYGQPAFAAWEQQNLSDGRGELGDLYWYRPELAKASSATRPLDRLFQGRVDIMFMRSAWNDPMALYLGIKGGYNQSGHCNLDIGTFVLDALGERWACDLGSESYGLDGYWDKTQGGKRWDYYRCNSRSHNVPLFDDTNQHAMAVAGLTEYKISLGDSFVVLNLTGAYSRFTDSALRGARIVDGRRAILIQDEFVVHKPCRITWGMTTKARIAVDGGQATLTQANKKLRVIALSPEGAVFQAASAEQKPPQKTNSGFRRLILPTDVEPGLVRVAMLFRPIWKGSEVTAKHELVPLSTWR